jgi:alanyl-tRNA synthetase
LWNLVFMQYDRNEAGELDPLPAPSIDTGAGLERLAAVLQGVDSNFHTDLFRPLIDRAAEVVGRPYEADGEVGLSYRVLADHARAVAFLLADGVFPANDGRGYVLRRILRRAVRHAWLLGRRAPTLVGVVEAVVDTMAPVFPELAARREHLLQTTRGEEERFLATIEGGLERFDELVPEGSTGTLSGDEAFRLYDTFGFPLDLTQLMAAERGWQVDEAGFSRALEAQRERSRADRAASRVAVDAEESLEDWTVPAPGALQDWVGYDHREVETPLLAWRDFGDGRAGLVLARNPFYLESGGQVSDRGRVEAPGWSLTVDDVRRVGGYTAVCGALEGDLESDEIPVAMAVVAGGARHDTERNHTATHLLHAALRGTLGEHVMQRGSLVAPDRLRFDFAHTAPLSSDERRRVEEAVNEAIWADHPVRTRETSYDEAVRAGAMALFGEKYGDRVRVVEVPGVSTELCGGTHVRHTGEIGLFKLVSETGVAAGVRRVEAQTGPGAFRYFETLESRVQEAAQVLRAQPEHLARRAEQMLEEQARLERLLEDLRKGGGAGAEAVVEASIDRSGQDFVYRGVRLKARDADDVRAWGDGFLAEVGSGVAVVAAELPDDKYGLFSFVSDDLISLGVRADEVIREVAAVVGGRGGGRPHLAQGGVGDPERLDEALARGESVVRRLAHAT